VIYFTCDDGYNLVGNNSIQCQKNGLWSGIVPSCILINADCGDPGTPRHGIKFYMSTTFGSVLNFSCLSGYILVGSISIQCNSDGRWSDVLPQCLPIDCGDPGTPLFGRRQLSNTTYQSTVNYSCFNSSYQLVGSVTSKCLANGSWSEVLPQCVFIGCGSPEFTPFGIVEYSGDALGSIVTYSCQEGYRLVGVVQRTCLDNKTWSGDVPTCVPITHCGNPDIPVFGVRLNGNLTVGSTVMYDCIIGYKLIGSAMRTCLLNGTWSGIVPFCKLIDCGDPGTPHNGTRMLSGTRLRSTVMYSCDDGYLLIGSSMRECLDNESWSGVPPKCQLVDCAAPEIPALGGVVVIPNGDGRPTIMHTCFEGFKLVGEIERVCLTNGSWSGNVPSCVPITDCGFPDVPLLGLADVSDIVIGSVVVYSCNEGYMLLGNQNRTCLTNGKWSGDTPVCVHA